MLLPTADTTFTCNVEYCDFVVCTFCSDDGFFVERILRDGSLWQEGLVSCDCFFRKCILPELAGKWWTSPSSQLSKRYGVLPTTTASLSSTIVLPARQAPAPADIPSVCTQTTSAFVSTSMSSQDSSTSSAVSPAASFAMTLTLH